MPSGDLRFDVVQPLDDRYKAYGWRRRARYRAGKNFWEASFPDSDHESVNSDVIFELGVATFGICFVT